MQIKIKRRELLKLIPAIIGGSVVLKADGVEIEALEREAPTEGADCYVGLLEQHGFISHKTREVSGGGYARQGVKWKFVTEFGECKLINAKDVSFPTATAAWGHLTQVALYVEPQGGVVLFTSVLVKPWFIHADDTVMFVAGGLDITID